MPNPNEMICVIYTDTAEAQSGLVDAVARLLPGRRDPQTYYSVIVPRTQSRSGDQSAGSYILVDVHKYRDFNAELRSEFPSGFLYFRYRVEVYTDTNKVDAELKHVVERILDFLWSTGCPAVAACDFEEELPHRGGYKSTLIPWPAGASPK